MNRILKLAALLALSGAIAGAQSAGSPIVGSPNRGTVQPGAQYKLGCFPIAGSIKTVGPCANMISDVNGNFNLSASANIRGPGPGVDVLAAGLVGDAKISKNTNVTGATATIAGGSVNFAATDCQSGTGCTGTVNKIIAFNAGGPSGTITIAAPTPGASGQLVQSINYRWQAVEIIDTATLGTTGNTTNGWTLPTAEATVAEGANTSLAFPAASANVTNATGLRLYVTGGFGAAANSGEEVLQVPGKIAFGTVTSAGTGCTTGPVSLTVGAPSQAGGIQAVAHATCAAGALTGVTIDITGSGYTSNPTATPANGTGTVTLTVGLLCSAQSATNFRDFACNIGSTQTLASVTMVGPIVPTIAGWRSVINAFTSTTSVTIADTIPNNIAGGTNFAGWATDNTAAWLAGINTFAPCTQTGIGTISTYGCHVFIPSTGSNGAPTGRYFFLNGMPIVNNGMMVEGRGGRGSPPNGGAAISTNPTPSAEIVELGDSYAINVGSNTGSFQGAELVNLAAEDLLPGMGWGGYNVGGDFGVSLTATHVEIDRPTAVNFVNGYGLQLTNIQRVNIFSPWMHAAVQFRFSDSVSATQLFGGMATGAQNTTGLGLGLWISNNPIAAINQFGNIKFFGLQIVDGGYEGFRRISDSSYNVFYGLKQENISLSGGAACPGGGTACYGTGLWLEGNTAGRCVNNIDMDTHSARTVNYLSETIPNAGQSSCTQTDVIDPIVTQNSGTLCAQTPCNLNDSSLDLRLGNNSRNASQASFQNGGMSFGPDILSGATPAIKCENGNTHQFRAMGQAISPTFSGASCGDGQEITVEACQNGTGGFTWTWPAGFTNTSPISLVASACTKQTFHWDATNAVAVGTGAVTSYGVNTALAGMTLDMNAATGANALRIPVQAGCTAAALTGDFCYDSTNGNNHVHTNASDSLAVTELLAVAANTILKATNGTNAMAIASSMVDNATTVTSAEGAAFGTAAGIPGYTDKTIGITTVAMGAQTTATPTNITGATWNLAASKNYLLRCEIPRTLAASATLSYTLAGPGTPTSYSLDVQGANGTAGAWADLNTLAAAAYGTATTASAAAANTAIDKVWAQIRNGATASGTALTLQTIANGTNAITILANVSCTLTQEN